MVIDYQEVDFGSGKSRPMFIVNEYMNNEINLVPEDERENERDQWNYVQKDDGISWRCITETIVV